MTDEPSPLLTESCAAALFSDGALASRIESEPRLILTNLFHPSTFQTQFAAYNHGCQHDAVANGSAMQAHLATLTSAYLRRFDQTIAVKERYPYFPSDFVVRFMNYPVLSFNIYTHTFSDARVDTEVELRRAEQITEERVIATRRQLERCTRLLKRPITYVQGPVDLWRYLTKKDDLVAAIARRARGCELTLQGHRQTLRYLTFELTRYTVVREFIDRKYAELEQRFTQDYHYQFISHETDLGTAHDSTVP